MVRHAGRRHVEHRTVTQENAIAVVPGTPDVQDHTCVLLCQLDIVAGKATVRVAPGYRVMYDGDHYSIRYKAP